MSSNFRSNLEKQRNEATLVSVGPLIEDDGVATDDNQRVVRVVKTNTTIVVSVVVVISHVVQ